MLPAPRTTTTSNRTLRRLRVTERRIREAHGLYRQMPISRIPRQMLRGLNALTLVAFGGLGVTAGGVLMAIGAAQAQLVAAGAHPAPGLFAYGWFQIGFGLCCAGGAVGLVAVITIASQSSERKEIPLEFEVDYGVYSHESLPDSPRRLRVRVVSYDPSGLIDVRVRILGGSKIKTAGWLREYDDSAPYADSRKGVPIPPGQHRYFLVAEIGDYDDQFSLGFINQRLVEEHPLPMPTMEEDDHTYLILMADARRTRGMVHTCDRHIQRSRLSLPIRCRA